MDLEIKEETAESPSLQDEESSSEYLERENPDTIEHPNHMDVLDEAVSVDERSAAGNKGDSNCSNCNRVRDARQIRFHPVTKELLCGPCFFYYKRTGKNRPLELEAKRLGMSKQTNSKASHKRKQTSPDVDNGAARSSSRQVKVEHFSDGEREVSSDLSTVRSCSHCQTTSPAGKGITGNWRNAPEPWTGKWCEACRMYWFKVGVTRPARLFGKSVALTGTGKLKEGADSNRAGVSPAAKTVNRKPSNTRGRVATEAETAREIILPGKIGNQGVQNPINAFDKAHSEKAVIQDVGAADESGIRSNFPSAVARHEHILREPTVNHEGAEKIIDMVSNHQISEHPRGPSDDTNSSGEQVDKAPDENIQSSRHYNETKKRSSSSNIQMQQERDSHPQALSSSNQPLVTKQLPGDDSVAPPTSSEGAEISPADVLRIPKRISDIITNMKANIISIEGIISITPEADTILKDTAEQQIIDLQKQLSIVEGQYIDIERQIENTTLPAERKEELLDATVKSCLAALQEI